MNELMNHIMPVFEFKIALREIALVAKQSIISLLYDLQIKLLF